MRAAVLLVATCLASIAYADTEQDVRCSEIAFSKSAELRDAKAFRSFIATPDCLIVGAAQVKNGVDDGTRPLLTGRERSSGTHWNHKLRPTGITTRGSTLPLARPRYARLSIWWA